MLKGLLARVWRGSPVFVKRAGVWLKAPRFTVTAGAVLSDGGVVGRGSPVFVKRAGVWLTQPRFTVTAGAVISDEGGRVLLLRHVLRRGSGWGIPGGFLNAGEQPDEAVRRELCEESGLELDRR